MVLAIGKLLILDIGRMDDAEMSVEPILHAALKLLKRIYVMSVNPSIGDEKLSELATEQELSDKKPDELQATIEALQQQIFNRPR